MKKVLVPILLLVAVAAIAVGIFLTKQKSQPQTKTQPHVAVPENSTKVVAAVKEEAVPQQQEKATPQPSKQIEGPFEVYFTAPTPPKISKGQPVVVTLQVASVPGNWPAELGPEARLDLLLRLPISVKLDSAEEGWTPVQLPTDADAGSWSVYEKQVPLQLQQGVPPGELLTVQEIHLIVTEEGINWILSTRARLTQGSQVWQTFGLMFATLQGEEGEFHGTPKTPRDTESAQETQSAQES